jgi:PTS system nitrogen regulatory IIA component
MPLPSQLLSPERILLDADVASKKRLLETLAGLLTSDLEVQQSIYDKLLERERLGSTALGHGVALPHARLDDVKQPVAAFVRVKAGLDFDSPDGEKAFLALALLVPQEATDEHLQLLAQSAGLFNQASVRDALLHAANAGEVIRLLTDNQERLSA